MKIDAQNYKPLDRQKEAKIKAMIGAGPFPSYLGMEPLEVRKDYGAMRIKYRDVLNQPVGFIHGGVIMSLMDTVVVLAIFSGVDLDHPPRRVVTIDMHTHFLAAVIKREIVGYGVVRRRGSEVCYLSAETRTTGGRLIATASMAYMVK